MRTSVLVNTPVLGLIIICVALLISCSSESSPRPAGDLEFALEDLQGRTVKFSEFSGKVLLVDFWATWCPPCRRSVPLLAELHTKYSRNGFEVVGISLDNGRETVRNFATEYRIPYKVLMGNQEVARNWNIGSGIPVAFVVNREGQIVDKMVGYQSMEVLESKIKRYL